MIKAKIEEVPDKICWTCPQFVEYCRAFLLPHSKEEHEYRKRLSEALGRERNCANPALFDFYDSIIIHPRRGAELRSDKILLTIKFDGNYEIQHGASYGVSREVFGADRVMEIVKPIYAWLIEKIKEAEKSGRDLEFR